MQQIIQSSGGEESINGGGFSTENGPSSINKNNQVSDTNEKILQERGDQEIESDQLALESGDSETGTKVYNGGTGNGYRAKHGNLAYHGPPPPLPLGSTPQKVVTLLLNQLI